MDLENCANEPRSAIDNKSCQWYLLRVLGARAMENPATWSRLFPEPAAAAASGSAFRLMAMAHILPRKSGPKEPS